MLTVFAAAKFLFDLVFPEQELFTQHPDALSGILQTLGLPSFEERAGLGINEKDLLPIDGPHMVFIEKFKEKNLSQWFQEGSSSLMKDFLNFNPADRPEKEDLLKEQLFKAGTTDGFWEDVMAPLDKYQEKNPRLNN